VTFNVDELNQRAIDEAIQALSYAAAPIGESRRPDIAEAIVRILQRLQHDHGMGYMLLLSGNYDARHRVSSEMYAMHSVTGPQTDTAIQVAAKVLWDEA
jgi:hypothetical protein